MRFHHICNPCYTCDSTGMVHDAEECGPEGCTPGCQPCDVCEGQSRECDCVAAWEYIVEQYGRG
jgi:hypothetical protein